MLTDWNFWFSIITAVVAIVALFQTAIQVNISNKQHLFDRRLNAYMLAQGLINLCKENIILLNSRKDDSPAYASDLLFVLLTNNTFMEKQAEAIGHTLEQPFHTEFLKKREELRNIAAEIQIIFKGKGAKLYSEFVNHYEAALHCIYQYQIIINKMKKENTKHTMTEKELQNMFYEPEYRKNLYLKFDELLSAYKAVSQPDIEKNIKKQLILK